MQLGDASSRTHAGAADVRCPNLSVFLQLAQPELEELYWQERGNAWHIRSDFVLIRVMIILHLVILARPLHAIFLVTRLCRLVIWSFQLYALVFQPHSYGRNRTKIALALRLAGVITLWLMQFYISNHLEVYRMFRADMHVEGPTLKPVR